MKWRFNEISAVRRL